MFASTILAIALVSAPEAPRLILDRDTGQAAWQVRVATAGLALNDQRGAQEMLARLKQATNDLCTREMRTHAERDWHTCRRDTLGEAVQKLNAPLVTRAYEANR